MSRPDIGKAYDEQNDALYAWCLSTCRVCSAFLSARMEEDDGGNIRATNRRYCKRCEKKENKENK